MPNSDDAPLPRGWESRTSRSTGLSYFLNTYTKKSQWDRPTAPATPGEIKCSHILVKHAQSRRPASWREPKITRSKEDAIDALKTYRAVILAEEKSFTDIAKAFSDCSSARHDGDLGYFRMGQMQKPFEDEAFRLKVGQLSHVIETESGFHIILRTA